MKPTVTRLPLMLLGLGLVAVLVFVAAPRQAEADTATVSWTEGFEGYTACPDVPTHCDNIDPALRTDLYFPSSNWTHSGLRDTFVYTDRPHEGSQVLKAHGLNDSYGASIAYRAIGGYPPYEIDFWAQSIGDRALLPTGGFRKTVGVELGTGPTFTSYHRGLLSFTVEDLFPVGSPDRQDLEIWGGFLETDESYLNGEYLGLWQGNNYHHINIKYEPVTGDHTKVRITWTVDNRPPVSRVYDVNWYENSLDYIGLWAAGGQVWFDHITVTSASEPFFFDTPDAPELNEKVYLPLITR
ncbi:MAG: hypothetical protein RRC07_14915 [Anaerolineae bacterium]|nr:hypothetical protein [Anaerolineae bacterium]